MAHQGICSVSGCCNTLIVAKDFCEKHYRRFRAHGDPNAGRLSPGEHQQFFTDVVLKYDGNECLIWPYSKTPKGYGLMSRVGASGKRDLVHRRVCEEINGPPPTPEHQAAHSCGKGLQGCCAKRHVSWKTVGGNTADRFLHGTVTRGETISKVTEEEVRQIRARIKSGETQRSVAKDYDISFASVCRIHLRQTWAWLD